MNLRSNRSLSVEGSQYNGAWSHIRGNMEFTGQSPYAVALPSNTLFRYQVKSNNLILYFHLFFSFSYIFIIKFYIIY